MHRIGYCRNFFFSRNLLSEARSRLSTLSFFASTSSSFSGGKGFLPRASYGGYNKSNNYSYLTRTSFSSSSFSTSSPPPESVCIVTKNKFVNICKYILPSSSGTAEETGGVKEPSIGVITLDREQGRNSISTQFLDELRDCISYVQTDERMRAVLVVSTLKNVFCAGADLKERASMSVQEVRNFTYKLRETMSLLESLPPPSIACIDGAALGGGLELALACDFRIGGENAFVGLPETSLAIIPGAGGTQRLPRVIGEQRAKFLIYTAKKLNATEALKYGVFVFTVGINDYKIEEENYLNKNSDNNSNENGRCDESIYSNMCEEYDELLSKVVKNKENIDEYKAFLCGLRLANAIARNGPVAVRAAKKSIQEGMQTDIHTAMDIERQCYELILDTHDRVEALDAFKNKRKPVFRGC